MSKADFAPADVDFMAHGTTVVINALTERKGVAVGQITTEGFRDSLEIARGNRPDFFFNLHYEKPAPSVPRNLRAEVPGRMTYQRDERAPLDLTGLPAILDGFARKGLKPSRSVCCMAMPTRTGQRANISLFCDGPRVRPAIDDGGSPELL